MTRPGVPAVVAAVTAGILALSLASSALAGGKPETVKIPVPEPVVFPAGLSCPFPVEWAFESKNLQSKTFPVQANGDQLVRQTGHVMTTVTNLDSGASLVVNTSDRQDFLFHADGTIDVTINGGALAAYYPTDLGGPAMYYFKGHLHDLVDSEFTLVSHQFSGRSTDLCAALS
jgi:hypothetical protein